MTATALLATLALAVSGATANANDFRGAQNVNVLSTFNPSNAYQPLSFPSRDRQANDGAAQIEISAVPGPVAPPVFDQQLMHQFDAVAACAGADVEIEGLMLPPEELAQEPALPHLEQFWLKRGANRKAIALGAEVPPLFLARVPKDLTPDLDVARKKRAFILMMLPHILAVNEEIRADRRRVENIRGRLEDPIGPSPAEIDWLFARLEAYGVKGFDLKTLMTRMDIIPPSLAIAQAAKESGWGGSRFARAGNALYGQWTWNPNHKGIVPSKRDSGKTHRVRAFDSLLAATRAYAININTHAAYARLREIRRSRRAKGLQATGREMSVGLGKYSEIGQRYVRAVRSIIRRNGLAKLDDARLAPSLTPEPLPAAFQGLTDKFSNPS